VKAAFRDRVLSPAPGLARITSGIKPNIRSFVGAVVELRRIRRQLRVEGVDARVPRAKGLGPRGRRGVQAAVTVTRATCLERALLIQGWIGGYSVPPDVVIGVRSRSGAVAAHAWVDGPDPWFDADYEELTRLSW
jgi:hypothetical protein